MAEYEELLLDTLVDNTQAIHRSLTKLKSSSMEINLLLRKILDLLPNPNLQIDEPEAMAAQVFDQMPKRMDTVTIETKISNVVETEVVKEIKVFHEMSERVNTITMEIEPIREASYVEDKVLGKNSDSVFGMASSEISSCILEDKDDLEGKVVTLRENEVFDAMVKTTSDVVDVLEASNETKVFDQMLNGVRDVKFGNKISEEYLVKFQEQISGVILFIDCKYPNFMCDFDTQGVLYTSMNCLSYVLSYDFFDLGSTSMVVEVDDPYGFRLLLMGKNIVPLTGSLDNTNDMCNFEDVELWEATHCSFSVAMDEGPHKIVLHVFPVYGRKFVILFKDNLWGVCHLEIRRFKLVVCDRTSIGVEEFSFAMQSESILQGNALSHKFLRSERAILELGHLRILVAAQPNYVFFTDFIHDECKVNSKTEMLNPFNVVEEDQFLEFPRAGSYGFQFASAIQSLWLPCVEHNPKSPNVKCAQYFQIRLLCILCWKKKLQATYEVLDAIVGFFSATSDSMLSIAMPLIFTFLGLAISVLQTALITDMDDGPGGRKLKANSTAIIEVSSNQLIVSNAKSNFDDNVAFRQKQIFSLHDASQEDPREVTVAKACLNFIGLDGEISCMVNGATIGEEILRRESTQACTIKIWKTCIVMPEISVALVSYRLNIEVKIVAANTKDESAREAIRFIIQVFILQAIILEDKDVFQGDGNVMNTFAAVEFSNGNEPDLRKGTYVKQHLIKCEDCHVYQHTWRHGMA